MAKVVAVSKDETGRMEYFRLDDGRTVNLRECANLVLAGELPDLVVGSTVDNLVTVRSEPDHDLSNNLSNLPEF